MKKNREGYKMTELGEIPVKWKVDKLCEIGEILMGQSPLGDSYNSSGNGLPLLNGPTEFTNKSPIPKQWTTKPTKICQYNDILFCVRGSSTGRMNISNDKYCIGRGLAAIRGKEGVSITAFIYYFLQTSIERILNLSAGSTFPNVSRDDLSDIPCILPCLKEQQKIADILSTVDEHIEETENLIEKTKDLKKGFMQRLLTKGIGHTKFKKTEVGEIPVEWEVKKLSDIIKLEYGFSLPEKDRVKGQYPVYGSQGIIGYNKVSFVDAPGIILGRKGSIDKVNYSTEAFCPIDTTYYVNNYRDNNWKWLYYILCNKNLKSLNSATGVPSLNRNDVYELKIALPGLEEQKVISNIISEVDSIIEQGGLRKEKLQQLKQALMQKLLTGKIRVKV